MPVPAALVYTVPAGETALVKWVSVYNNSGTLAADFSLYVAIPPGGALRIYRQSVAPGQDVQEALWWALPPGAQLWANGGLAGTTVAAIFGAELEGVAD